jgi:hypothetical protein
MTRTKPPILHHQSEDSEKDLGALHRRVAQLSAAIFFSQFPACGWRLAHPFAPFGGWPIPLSCEKCNMGLTAHPVAKGATRVGQPQIGIPPEMLGQPPATRKSGERPVHP